MFFVYFKAIKCLIAPLIFPTPLQIYQAFAKHRARQIYRQKVGAFGIWTGVELSEWNEKRQPLNYGHN
jgi:hypothetical protein